MSSHIEEEIKRSIKLLNVTDFTAQGGLENAVRNRMQAYVLLEGNLQSLENKLNKIKEELEKCSHKNCSHTAYIKGMLGL